MIVSVLMPAVARADEHSGPDAVVDDDAYLLHHPDARWWLSGQLNVISQAQPGFHSPYRGANSFIPDDHAAISVVATVYGAYELTSTTAIMIAGESAGGGGLSQALGFAGFSNLDVVRNPTLGPTPYLGRAMIEQIIPLDGHRELHDRPPFNVLRHLPGHRIAVRAGKLSTVDFFDVNSVGSDSHLQFMNWALANNGAYDYAADTRGYTLGAVVEYAAPRWALRYGAMLMPTVANGIDYDYDIAHARGEQLELELHDCIGGHEGIVRVLGYYNHAKMGSYAEANAEARTGIVDVPDITATRVVGRTKGGVALGIEHELPGNARVFGRVGWADGVNESFAYTEIENSISLGADLLGSAWGRDRDRVAIAAVTSGLSTGHRDYLALGGQGFLLGDGKLHYGREDIVEAYYTAHAYRGVSPALDIQVVNHPGFNVDRGPIVIGSLRLHVEL